MLKLLILKRIFFICHVNFSSVSKNVFNFFFVSKFNILWPKCALQRVNLTNYMPVNQINIVSTFAVLYTRSGPSCIAGPSSPYRTGRETTISSGFPTTSQSLVRTKESSQKTSPRSRRWRTQM